MNFLDLYYTVVYFAQVVFCNESDQFNWRVENAYLTAYE
jgi:hypothetical protein